MQEGTVHSHCANLRLLWVIVETILAGLLSVVLAIGDDDRQSLSVGLYALVLIV